MQFVDDRRLAARLSASSTAIAWSTRKARCWATRTSTSSAKRFEASCSAARAIVVQQTAAADDRTGPHPAHRRAGRPARRPHADRAMITRKAYISEMDLLRLQKALLMCRMSANSTFLVDKEEPGYSSKLDYLEELLDGLFAESIARSFFSEWTTMLDLIEPLLEVAQARLRAPRRQVPQKDARPWWTASAKTRTAGCFITTNAGSTGLNLQAANTVINVDLPWNPAVLEQRIARAHRMGQQQPVQVYVLVTEGTIEEGLLNTLSAKHDLALAALDLDSDVDAGRSGGRHGRVAEAAGSACSARPARSAGRCEPEGRGRGERTRSGDGRRSGASAWRPPAASCWAPSSISSASWWPKSSAAARRRPRKPGPHALDECVEQTPPAGRG